MYASIVLYVKHNCKQTNTLKGMKMLNKFIVLEYLFPEYRMFAFLLKNKKIIFLHFKIIFA